MSNSWQQQREKGSALCLAVLCWIALHLGRRVIRVILAFVVFYYFLFAAQARRASRQFLAKVLPEEGALRRSWQIYRHLLTFAQVSIDRIFFLADKKDMFEVQLHGLEALQKFSGTGCILLTSHLGSFDAMRVVAVRNLSLKLRILLDIQHNAQATTLIQRLDPTLAAGIIDSQTAGPALALQINEAIANAEHVGIMADRVSGKERALTLDFLGSPAQFPEGPWHLASVLQVPVLACFGIYRGGNRYDVHVELIAEQLGANRRERPQAIAVAMHLYTERLAHYAQTFPFNWFNFYDFWQDESSANH
ncbi:MAG TPA: hypothetical protein VN030_13315 [Cellvibrio sp.]|nr:hypothetical protein [Cellvibrio sp.]